MEIREYDVLCVGAGGSGVTAAVVAASQGVKVGIVSKDPIGYGNTRMAQGGMNRAGLVESDSAEEYVRDLLEGGEGLNNLRLIRRLAEESPLAPVQAEDLGHIFERDEEGRLRRPRDLPAGAGGGPGGHRFPRFVGGQSRLGYSGGIAIGQVLRAAAARSGLEVHEEVLVTKLLVSNGAVQGALGLRMMDSELLVLMAKTVILATGGAGWLYYPHTDAIRSLTGDGFALALEAGAELVDMEQCQFIPFGVNRPRAYLGLYIGEGRTAGGSGRLLNGAGEVLLNQVQNMTRAQLSKRMAQEILGGKTTARGGLLLDLSSNIAGLPEREAEARRRQQGGMGLIRRAYGLKAYRWEEPWDVAPTYHFHNGGIRIDEFARASLEGLYAAGEVSGGVHGANRLGGAALTEVFVFGRIAGQDAALKARQSPAPSLREATIHEEEERLHRLMGAKGRQRPVKLARRLQRLMWEKVGLARTANSCQEALEEIAGIREAAKDLSIANLRRYNTELADALELGLMLSTAEAIARSALERKESRGGHFRLDFPEQSEAEGLKNIILWKEGDTLRLRREAVVRNGGR